MTGIKVNNIEYCIALLENAHKRLDEYHDEIMSLRSSRHDHARVLQRHESILMGIKDNLDKLFKNIEEQRERIDDNTATIDKLMTKADTIIYMGYIFFVFSGFVSSKLLHLW